MPGMIQRLEIFAAGTWEPANGGSVTVSEADLDQMVENFSLLDGTNVVKPHLKLGHTDAQKWFGQKVGIPTLGWISNVWREGKKLFADVSNVPEALLDLIRQGRYHNVSAEIYKPGAIEYEGKKLGHVLSAVAILGTEMPAVKDLAGLAAALFADQFTAKVEAQPLTFNQARTNAGMFTQEQVDSLVAAAVANAKAGVTAEFNGKIADLETQVGVLTKRAETAEIKLSEQAEAFAATEMERLVDAAIKDGRVLPKQKDTVLGFGKAMKGTVNFGGKEQPALDAFKDFLASFSKQVDTTEKGAGREGSNTGTFATAAQEVDALTKAKVAESGGKMEYSAAMRAVLAADADLSSRYAQGV